jgi:uncharacterized protein (TIGR03435 family)
MKHRTTDARRRWKMALFATTAGVAVVALDATGFAMPSLRGASPAQVGGPAFEVVSVAPNKSGDARGACCRLESAGRLTATNATLRELIQSAYQRHAFDRREIEGGPPWIDSARFDLVAQAAGEHAIDSDGLPRQTWLMLRTLLADWFKLRVHVESRSRSIYALVTVGSDRQVGPRLRRSEIDYAAVTAMFIKGQRPEKPACSSASYPGRLVATALTLASVASILSGSVDRTVVDHTGLTGTFDLELEAVEIRPPGPFGPSFRPSDTKQSIFMALPQQLGLALEAMQGTVDVLVIDSAEQPTPSNP